MGTPRETIPEKSAPAMFDRVFEDIRNDEQNAAYTAAGIDPLYSASASARIVIIGQAPGRVAQDTRVPWNDRSGDRLREWLGMDRDTFYDPSKVAIIPMDFYFPGTGKSGDLPPRKGFAEKWHPILLQMMPQVELTVLVGSYAVHHYLGLKSSVSLTSVVQDYRSYLPARFPLVHPSPRNQIWMRNNPWFAEEVLPDLRATVARILRHAS